MSERITEATLAMAVAPYSARWPASDASSVWAALHAVVIEARQAVRDADAAIAKVEANRDLSVGGALKQITAAGLGMIARLREAAVLARAERLVAGALQSSESALATGRKPTTDPAAMLLEGEIRAFIRRQPDPGNFAIEHRGDARVFAAVVGGPAFLSGLSDETHHRFIDLAEQALHPEAVEARNTLTSALEEARRGVDKATKLIAERARLVRTGDGYSAPASAA